MGRRVAVVVRPEAVDDLREARDYYAAVDLSLSRALRDEFDRVIERLEMFPASGSPVGGIPGVRRARLRGFPYGVFYLLTDTGEVRILRVLHFRRDPPHTRVRVESAKRLAALGTSDPKASSAPRRRR